MKLKLFNHSAIYGAVVACISLSAALPSAFTQSNALNPPKPGMSEALDRILAAEKPLGDDSWRAQMLAQSPRKHEIAKISGGDRTLQAFVVYPTTKDPVPVIIMDPEDQGLSNWALNMADQLAAMGNIVIVPDLISGFGPNGGGQSAFPNKKTFMMNLLLVKEESMIADQNAWADWGKKLPQANGKLAAMGFGWGGGRAFWFATQRKDLTAAFIFYDVAPPAQALAGLTAPVYGFYAEDDPRVTRSLEATKAAMATAGKKYEQIVYPGSQHMFVRLGEEPGNTNPGNVRARFISLARLQELLKSM